MKMDKNAQTTVEYVLLIALITAMVLGISALSDPIEKKIISEKKSWARKFAGIGDTDEQTLTRGDFYTTPVHPGEMPGGAGTDAEDGREETEGEKEGEGGTAGKKGTGSGRGTAAGTALGTGDTGSEFGEKGDKEDTEGEGDQDAYGRGKYGQSEDSLDKTEFDKRKKRKDSWSDENEESYSEGTSTGTRTGTEINKGITEEEKKRRELNRQLQLEDRIQRVRDRSEGGSFSWKMIIIFLVIVFFILIFIRSRSRK
jgi:hypothetical protein